MANVSLDGILDRVFAAEPGGTLFLLFLSLFFFAWARRFRRGIGGSVFTGPAEGVLATDLWGCPRGVGREKFAPVR